MTIQFTSKKVGELLKKGNLRIPSYQRPYKWNRKHIRNLFYDLRDAMGKKEYQIGSVILHENDRYLDIVDGQQRLHPVFLYPLISLSQELNSIQKNQIILCILHLHFYPLTMFRKNQIISHSIICK